jgi:hypothetical protein
VQHAEPLALLAPQAVPVSEGSVENRVGADQVRLHEIDRAVDGVVHVRLRGEVQHGHRPVLGEEREERGCVAYVRAPEMVSGLGPPAGHGRGAARVGQPVDVHDLGVVGREELFDHR